MCALRFSGPARFIFCNRLMKPVDYKIARATSTVNEKEVKHHSNLKDIWWNEQLFSLHAFNPLRVEFIRKGLANVGFKEQTPSLPLQGVKIIDVGCAGGILTESLARIGAQMTGIDPSEELIDVAKEHITLSPNILQRVNYIHTTIEELSPTNEKQYDAVVASEVIEHVQNYKLFLQECLKVLKPGGSIF